MTSILRNKNCLITGASGGLGSALARQLAKSGCNLFLVGRNTEKLSQLSKEILEKNGIMIKVSVPKGKELGPKTDM